MLDDAEECLCSRRNKVYGLVQILNNKPLFLDLRNLKSLSMIEYAGTLSCKDCSHVVDLLNISDRSI